jgi:hypothetical protein
MPIQVVDQAITVNKLCASDKLVKELAPVSRPSAAVSKCEPAKEVPAFVPLVTEAGDLLSKEEVVKGAKVVTTTVKGYKFARYSGQARRPANPVTYAGSYCEINASFAASEAVDRLGYGRGWERSKLVYDPDDRVPLLPSTFVECHAPLPFQQPRMERYMPYVEKEQVGPGIVVSYYRHTIYKLFIARAEIESRGETMVLVWASSVSRDRARKYLFDVLRPIYFSPYFPHEYTIESNGVESEIVHVKLDLLGRQAVMFVRGDYHIVFHVDSQWHANVVIRNFYNAHLKYPGVQDVMGTSSYHRKGALVTCCNWVFECEIGDRLFSPSFTVKGMGFNPDAAHLCAIGILSSLTLLDKGCKKFPFFRRSINDEQLRNVLPADIPEGVHVSKRILLYSRSHPQCVWVLSILWKTGDGYKVVGSLYGGNSERYIISMISTDRLVAPDGYGSTLSPMNIEEAHSQALSQGCKFW